MINAKSGKTKRILVLNSRDKTAFRGFIVNIYSLIDIYNECVEEKKICSMIPTYYLLQDVVEQFFGRIRAQNGFNSNPNVLQFKGAYRKLLCNIKVKPPETGNCRVFDRILPSDHNLSNIFMVSSRRSKIALQNFENEYETQKDAILADVVAINEIQGNNSILDSCLD